MMNTLDAQVTHSALSIYEMQFANRNRNNTMAWNDFLMQIDRVWKQISLNVARFNGKNIAFNFRYVMVESFLSFWTFKLSESSVSCFCFEKIHTWISR